MITIAGFWPQFSDCDQNPGIVVNDPAVETRNRDRTKRLITVRTWILPTVRLDLWANIDGADPSFPTWEVAVHIWKKSLPTEDRSDRLPPAGGSLKRQKPTSDLTHLAELKSGSAS